MLIPQTAYDQVERLVAKFKNLPTRVRREYNEDNTRKDFILPLFRALQWDIDDMREVTAEEKISRGYVDFAFRLNGVPRFMLETKRMGEDLTKQEFARQAIEYAYHKDVTWAVLSDFEGLKVLNAEFKESNPLSASFMNFGVDEYVPRLAELWWLSRPAMLEGILDREGERFGKRSFRTPITTSLFDNLRQWRQDLYKTLRAYNPLWSPENIDNAVQRILDRLIFIRTAEDRRAEPETLLSLVHQLRDQNRLNDLLPRLIQRFRELDAIYNSQLFAPHLCENLDLGEPATLADIIEQMTNAPGNLIRYNFDFVDADVLGRAYEQYLGYVVSERNPAVGSGSRGKAQRREPTKASNRAKRKSQGIYYTPTFVVKYIVQQTLGRYLEERGYNPAQPVRVLDPASGSGSFLIEAFDVLDRYLARTMNLSPRPPFLRGQGEKDSPLLSGEGQGERFVDYARQMQILTENIYGVDKDEQAVEVARLNLMLQALHTRGKLPKLEHVCCGDSLIGGTSAELEEYFGAEWRKKNPFNWEQEFPRVFGERPSRSLETSKVLDSGGFDVIVGNPPYGMLQPHNTDAAMLDYLNAKYQVSSYKIDMFHLFIERCLDLLRDDGFLGLIVPNTFITNVYTQKLRDLISSTGEIIEIIVSSERIFAEAEVNNAIFILQKQASPERRAANRVSVVLGADETFLTGQQSLAEKHSIRQSNLMYLGSGPWNIKLSDDSIELLRRIQQRSDLLGAVAKINRGLISGNRDKYFSEKSKGKKWLPIITGTDVSRYSISKAKEFVLFDKPKGAGGCWDPQVHRTSKIVIRQIGYYPIASYDTHPYCVTGNIFTARPTNEYAPQYLLGVLNSKFTQWLWQLLYGDFKAIFPELKGIYLEQFPIGRINLNDPTDKQQHDAIVALVAEMLELQKEHAEIAAWGTERAEAVQRRIAQVDAAIDAAVYRLYDLSQEEIEVVEGKVNQES